MNSNTANHTQCATEYYLDWARLRNLEAFNNIRGVSITVKKGAMLMFFNRKAYTGQELHVFLSAFLGEEYDDCRFEERGDNSFTIWVPYDRFLSRKLFDEIKQSKHPELVRYFQSISQDNFVYTHSSITAM